MLSYYTITSHSNILWRWISHDAGSHSLNTLGAATWPFFLIKEEGICQFSVVERLNQLLVKYWSTTINRARYSGNAWWITMTKVRIFAWLCEANDAKIDLTSGRLGTMLVHSAGFRSFSFFCNWIGYSCCMCIWKLLFIICYLLFTVSLYHLIWALFGSHPRAVKAD